MPRALVLCEYPSLHGGERSLLAMLGAAPPSGWTWTIAAPPAGPLARAVRRRGLELLPLRLHGPAGNRFAPATARRQLDDLLAAHRPALVHANSLSMSRLVGPVAAARRLPALGHLRDILRPSAAAIADLNRLTRLLAVSRATRDWYLALGLDEHRTHVVYNGIDLAGFQPAPSCGYLHRQLGLPRGAPLLGAVGQIGIRKGLDTTLAALRIVRRHVPAVHLLVVGARHSRKAESRAYEDRLRADARRPELAGHCHFLGVREDLQRLLPELTGLLHAARQEPLGRVLLEAAACGVPAVATDVGGTREIFPPGANSGLLVPADDPQAMAEAARQLLTDPRLRDELGRNARARAEAAFDARRAAERLVEHYASVAREPP